MYVSEFFDIFTDIKETTIALTSIKYLNRKRSHEKLEVCKKFTKLDTLKYMIKNF